MVTTIEWWRRGRVETSPLVLDAIRTIAYGLIQLADALEAGGIVAPVELAEIVHGITKNGHRQVAK